MIRTKLRFVFSRLNTFSYPICKDYSYNYKYASICLSIMSGQTGLTVYLTNRWWGDCLTNLYENGHFISCYWCRKHSSLLTCAIAKSIDVQHVNVVMLCNVIKRILQPC